MVLKIMVINKIKTEDKNRVEATWALKNKFYDFFMKYKSGLNFVKIIIIQRFINF